MFGMCVNLEIVVLYFIGEGGFCWVVLIFVVLRLLFLIRVVIFI